MSSHDLISENCFIPMLFRRTVLTFSEVELHFYFCHSIKPLLEMPLSKQKEKLKKNSFVLSCSKQCQFSQLSTVDS